MARLFISHSTNDDAVVRAVQQGLSDLGHEVWIDSRELRGGDPLWPDIQHAIEDAAAYAVVISPSGLQSKWVGKELRHALEVQKQRGKAGYPIVPLSLDGTRLGVLSGFFDEEPRYVRLSSASGGVESALHEILLALGARDSTAVAVPPRPKAKPLEELVLELDDVKFIEVQEGVRRPSGRARLVYEPATPGQREVASERSWRFVAPLGPLEADDLRWYLEKYAIWPSPVFRDRARKVEQSLVTWGRLLHDAAMPVGSTESVRRTWAGVDGHAGRRFSIHVDAALEAGASDPDVAAAREAGTLLLGLPWELLHDGTSFLFQGARPTRVRRRLPSTRDLDVAVVATPIRILLVSARPEDESCGYFDHRASALPLVEAMEDLAGVVCIEVLTPPTLPALRRELDRARRAREPYHVVHFDGPGMYDQRVGLGGLCFEHPDDAAKVERRRHQTVFTDELGPLLRDHRIALVYLDASQSAQAEQASESVASELLNGGVASVVAMSHSVLVETARRFVTAFYESLARGGRIGDAMLEGQRQLKDDTFRGRIFGAGELRLEDWFVPILFQQREDPQLFQETPADQTREDFQTALAHRMGALPRPPPATGFVGRSRDLLALERLLGRERYAVLRGQGGEGKTALAAELARWMVRSQQIRRAVFVSVEVHGTTRAVLDAIGRQLVPGYSVATFESFEQAEQPVVRMLVEQSTLVVLDNLETILAPPYLAADTPVALAEDTRRELSAILALCERLCTQGETRILFTSREALPAPFDAAHNRRELPRLDRNDAVKLIERVVNQGAPATGVADVERAAIEELVEAVNGHALTLALLAPSLRHSGVTATREALVDLMVDMQRRFPGNREQSLFASVELSMRRLSPDNRARARVLGLFQGGVALDALRLMMDWEEGDINSLARELVETGLATPNRYNHLSLDPALGPYLRGTLDDAEREALTHRWVAAMRSYVAFLNEQHGQNAELAATLTLLELPNLFALLAHVSRAGDAEATVDLATRLQYLLYYLGKPRLVAQVAETRDAAAARIGAAWNRPRFDAEQSRIEEQLASGRLREALAGAQGLLRQARVAGEQAYRGADLDLATAGLLLGRVLQMTGSAQHALPYLDDAQKRFESIAEARSEPTAARKALICFAEKGDCLFALGRLEDAAATYEEANRRAVQRGDERMLAVAKGQLASVRRAQRRYQDSLSAYAEARAYFTKLGEPGSVAVNWHETGTAYREGGQPEAAEDAYRTSLAISVQLGDVRGQARTLAQLGILYGELNRLEDAVSLFRRAADQYVAVADAWAEGRTRSNLGETLRRLGRLDDARQEIRRAIECEQPFGHTAEPWTTWAILAKIEADVGNDSAAAQARANAVASFLAYRRDGGENHDADGRISLAVTEKLLAGDAAAAACILQELASQLELSSRLRAFVVALESVIAGRRDDSLADDPELAYTSAAEILYLLEILDSWLTAMLDTVRRGIGTHTEDLRGATTVAEQLTASLPPVAEAIIYCLGGTGIRTHIVPSPFSTIWRFHLPEMGLHLRNRNATLVIRYPRSFDRGADPDAIVADGPALVIFVDYAELSRPPGLLGQLTLWINAETLNELPVIRRRDPGKWLARAIISQADARTLLPYQTRGNVSAALFYGREAELKSLLAGIRPGGILLGAHRSGKSSLLNELARRLGMQGRWACDCISFAGSDYRSFIDKTLKLLAAGPPRPDLTPAGWAALVHSRAKASGRKPILLLDEVDALLSYDAQRGYPLGREMRALQADGVCEFYLAGHKELRQAIVHEGSPYRNFAEELTLRGLTPKAAMELVQGPMRNIGVHVSDAHARQIVDGTAGVAVLVQEFCRRLLLDPLREDSEKIDDKAIASVEELPEFLGEVYEYYQYAKSLESEAVKVTVCLGKDVDRRTILDRLRAFQITLAYETFEEAINFLVRFGVLEEHRPGRFQLASRYLGTAITAHSPELLLEQIAAELSHSL